MKALALIVCVCFPASAQSFGRPPIIANAGLDQKMGAQAPSDVLFRNEAGEPVALGRYFGKPVILALVYYQCPSLCNMVLNGVVHAVQGLTLRAGEDYQIVAVSFDPRETSEMAAAKKRNYVTAPGAEGRSLPENGWHFLTGEQESSRALADAVGFHYAYDANTNQYVHPSAIMILTPQGRVSRYFYGIDYSPRDVRLGLVEASSGQIGTPVDQVLLYCFHYDPASGKYGLAIMNSIRAGGLLTLSALAAFVIVSLRRDRRTT